MSELQALVESGKLQVGTKLVWTRRLTGLHSAFVQSDGTLITEDGAKHKTPSGAARSISGKPVDGWHAWKLPSGTALASLRGRDG